MSLNEQNNIIDDDLLKSALLELTQKINKHKEKTFQHLETKLEQLGKNLNDKIDSYNKLHLDKFLKSEDYILRKKKIVIKDLLVFPLVNLEQLNNTNYLINLILICLSNISDLTSYFFSSEKEKKFLCKSKDPKGIYLSPSYLKLLDHMWKGTKEIYSPNELHEKLKILMKEDYNSPNPGIIINFIISQLHKDININKKDIIEADWNTSKKEAKNLFGIYFKDNYTKIFEIFLSMIRLEKISSEKQNLYLFKGSHVIDIFLDDYSDSQGLNNNILSFENFHALYKDKNDEKKYCSNEEKFKEKRIYSIPNILIININRNKNNNKKFKYPKILNTRYLINNPQIELNDYELKSVIIKKDINNIETCYAFCKNDINHKWHKYEKEKIILVRDENEIFDEENAYLLIYENMNKRDFVNYL